MWVTAAAFAALSIGLIEIVDAVSKALLFPSWTGRLVTFLLILAFPVVMVMAWIFDLEAGRLRRTEAAPATGSGPGHPAPGLSGAGRGAAATPGPVRPRSALGGAPAVPLPAASSRRAPAVPLSATPTGTAPDPDRLKRAALGHVRHELRTPINAILGYSEMLLEDEEDPAVQEDLQRIHEAGRRLLGLVDGILDPSRLAGAIDRDIASFAAQIEADLRTPINTVVGYSEILLEGQREAGRDVLVPDIQRILTAARSLLAASGDIVQVATQAPDAGGTGIGTRLRDSSELAKGVLSRLGAPADRTNGGSDGQGALLVVDDNPTNRDLLMRQLARHGYIVAAAADGAEALERLSAREFDLVLLDVIMPGMDGVETLRRLKEDERLREIPVIMLSSLDEVDSAIRCIAAGAEEYITKPVQGTLLEARIAANLEVRDLRARERAYRKRIESDAETIDRLLLSAFPIDVAARVRRGETRIVEEIPVATVLHCALAASRFGMGRLPEYVALLSEWLGVFETLAEDRGIDACFGRRKGFLAVARHPDGPENTDPAAAIADLSLAFQAEIRAAGDELTAQLRMGLHTGPAVAAVIGRDRLRFDLWGEALDTAKGLASAAEPGQVLVSPSAQLQLRDRFRLEPGRVVEVPELGQLRPYVLIGPGDEASARS